jgi:acylphosphatase
MTTRDDPASDARAVHLLVSGRVQGVGFRYFAMGVARTHGIVEV